MNVFLVTALVRPGDEVELGIFRSRKEAKRAINKALGFKVHWRKNGKELHHSMSEIPGLDYLEIFRWKIGWLWDDFLTETMKDALAADERGKTAFNGFVSGLFGGDT